MDDKNKKIAVVIRKINSTNLAFGNTKTLIGGHYVVASLKRKFPCCDFVGKTGRKCGAFASQFGKCWKHRAIPKGDEAIAAKPVIET